MVHGVFKGEDPTKPDTIVSLGRKLVVEFDSYMTENTGKGFNARYFNAPFMMCPCRVVKSEFKCHHRSITSFGDLKDKCDGYFAKMTLNRRDFTELTLDRQNINIDGNVTQTTSARSNFWF